MTLDHVKAFKAQVLDSDEVNRLRAAQTHSLVDPRPERRLGIGYSKVGKKNYRLELRVQKGHGIAFQEAEKIVVKAKGEARIAVAQDLLSIPSLRELLDKSLKGPLAQLRRPLHVGMSVGPKDGGAGTLGCFIDVKKQGVALLTASHVLTRFSDEIAKKAPVFQPGKPDVKRLSGGVHKIASLCNWSVNSRDDRNEIDAAAALLDADITHDGNRLPEKVGCPDEGESVGGVAEVASLDLDERVAKIGRTTRYTEGTVSSVALDGLPIYSSYVGNMLFDGIIEVEWGTKPFSLPGDSGSLVYTKDGRKAIGLVFAGGMVVSQNKKYGVSYVCPLQPILDDFDAVLAD